MDTKILVIGAGGQIGKELVNNLCKTYGNDNVVASDIKKEEDVPCAFEVLDVLDTKRLVEILKKHNIKEIYHLAALLSATAEQYPEKGWKLNMEGLLSTLELMREKVIDKMFWPSSIAVFGPKR